MIIPLVVWWFCLPDPLFDASYSTVLLDRNEQLMGARLAQDGQWRFPGDELEVPETFEKAIVVFEDKRFFKHIGVDVLAFGRAMRDNIKARSVVSGGSTLTMQTMRLARNRDARTMWQKGVEMLWAWRAELKYSKKEILQLYAAHAPFGGNVVGLGAATAGGRVGGCAAATCRRLDERSEIFLRGDDAGDRHLPDLADHPCLDQHDVVGNPADRFRRLSARPTTRTASSSARGSCCCSFPC